MNNIPSSRSQTNSIRKDRKRLNPELISIFFLTLAVILTHRYIISSEEGYFRFLIKWDLPQFIWPKLAFLTDSLREKIWPIWNPYDFAGTPIFSNLQTLYYHPLIFLYALTIGFTLKTLQIYLLIAYLFGAINMYLLAGFFNVPRKLCIAFGLLYSTSGFAIGNAEHFPQLHLFLTEPLTLFFLYRFSRQSSIPNFVLAVFGLSMLISGGYPSILGHLLVFNFLLFAISAFQNKSVKVKNLFLLCLIFLTSIMIMLPLLVPAFLSIPHITRGMGISYSTFASHSLSFPYLISLFNPLLGQMSVENSPDGFALKNCAIGVFVLLLTSYSICRVKGKSFLTIYLASAILGCLGDKTFMGKFFYSIPFLNNSRHVTFEFRVLLILIIFLIAISGINSLIKEKNKTIIFISFLLPLLIYLVFWFYIKDSIDFSIIQSSFDNYLGLSLSDSTLYNFLFVSPFLLGICYLFFALNSKWLINGFLAVAIIESFIIAPANYFTVLDPAPKGIWQKNSIDEKKRTKGFPIARHFKRMKVYPELSNIGSYYKIHTDWGMDGTNLKSITKLVASKQSNLLYGPYMWFSREDKKQVDSPDYIITRHTPNSLEIGFSEIEYDRTALFNFMHYPGWKAFSKRQERESSPSKEGFLSVSLKKGDYSLDIIFYPAYYYYLLTFSLILILTMTTFAFYKAFHSAANRNQ